MIFSRACLYGIRAALYVASQKNRKYVSIGEISQNLGISFHFLTKVLQKLTQKNLMTSYRGPNGGIALSKPAAEITLYEIVEAIECDQVFDGCILGLPGCGTLKPCPLHENWATIRGELSQLFTETDLESVAKRIKDEDLRISKS